jgi:nicotinate-nucleotide--dimethylbenzimidazole phosphoribosyltransferase
MVGSRSLVTPTSSPLLEKALREKLSRRKEVGGSLGELEPLAIRLGLMQNTLKPVLHDPQLLVFASDHGLADDHGLIIDSSLQPLQGTQMLACLVAHAGQSVGIERSRPVGESGEQRGKARSEHLKFAEQALGLFVE